MHTHTHTHTQSLFTAAIKDHRSNENGHCYVCMYASSVSFTLYAPKNIYLQRRLYAAGHL
jgi:hypothetical protein